jgi:hypothetical protein
MAGWFPTPSQRRPVQSGAPPTARKVAIPLSRKRDLVLSLALVKAPPASDTKRD